MILEEDIIKPEHLVKNCAIAKFLKQYEPTEVGRRIMGYWEIPVDEDKWFNDFDAESVAFELGCYFDMSKKCQGPDHVEYIFEVRKYNKRIIKRVRKILVPIEKNAGKEFIKEEIYKLWDKINIYAPLLTCEILDI